MLSFVSLLIFFYVVFFFFFKQKTAYEMRISDWSSDVCSSDLIAKADIEFESHFRRGPEQYGHITGEGPLGGQSFCGDGCRRNPRIIDGPGRWQVNGGIA